MSSQIGNNSKTKGTAGEYLAMAAIINGGDNVYSYSLDKGNVDFLIEKNNRFLKVQVKTFYVQDNNKIAYIGKKGSNGNTYYTDKDIDVLLLVDVETAEVFWIDMPVERKYKLSKRNAYIFGKKIFPLQPPEDIKDIMVSKVIDKSQTHTRPPISHSSKYKGVSWDKKESKWRARITHKGTFKHIGYYDNEEQAARAYDNKALETFGEDAYVNFK